MTEVTKTPESGAETSSKKSRKAAVIAGSAGVLGIAGVFAFANWTDNESVGANFTSGEFALEISTEQNPEGEWINWQSDTVSYANLADGAPELLDPWAPGDQRGASFAVRLRQGSCRRRSVVLLDEEAPQERQH